MILVKQIGDLKLKVDRIRRNGPLPAFVPTMGALHAGHIQLITHARSAGNPVVCSIFVNPTQFNDPKDFQKYPVTLEADIQQLESAGTELLFLPSVEELYPGGTAGLAQYDLGFLETVLEGKFRPGHFQGVCLVMHRLLEAVGPCLLYMGQKDYQQCMVVAKLIELENLSADLITVPTVREKDGLAMSSRNERLDENERKNATGIYKALTYLKENIRPGDLSNLKQQALAILHQHHFKTDYIEIADAKTLEPVETWNGTQSLVALAAAFQGEVRLIDNMNMPELF